jgi:hypothetical protein
VDNDFREPIQQAARSSNVVAKGQIKFFTQEELNLERGGSQVDGTGFVLFRYRDLKKLNITLKLTDRFIKLGNIDVDLYVVRIESKGHYPDKGGATLVRCYFEDRTPSRQNAGNL